MHWRLKVAAGKRYHHPVTALDFYPTFTRLAGSEVPSDQSLHSVDIWDSLQANESARPETSIFVLRHWNGFHNVGIRRGEWKAMKQGPKSAWKLYNIDADISETSNVASANPVVVKQMVSQAREWSRSQTQPEWFDNKAAERRWKENGMPVYQSTCSQAQ